MSDDKDISFFDGAWFSAVIAFFGTWVTAIVLFNFVGLVLGWLPALIVAIVVWITFPFLYSILYSLLGVVIIFLLTALFLFGLFLI